MEVSRILLRVAMLLACAPTARASAQLAELQLGARVRVRAPGEVAGRLTGMVLSRSADSLTMSRPNATPLTLAIAKLSTVEISRGKSRSRGALKGIAWGAASGLGLGLTPITESTCTGGTSAVRGTCEPVSRGSFIWTMVVGSVTIGAGVGALVGSERWQGGLLPTRVAVVPPTRMRPTALVLSWTTPRRHFRE